MRILRSIYGRDVFALVLTFLVCIGLCWLLTPHEPHYTYSVRGSASLWEIAPDNGSIVLYTTTGQEFYDITDGHRMPDPRSDALKHLRQDNVNVYGDGFVWNAPLAERCINYRQSIQLQTCRNSVLPIGPRLECLSDNGRYYSYALKGEIPFSWEHGGHPDHVMVIDLETGEQIANLAGTCYPVSIAPDGRTAMTITDKSMGKPNEEDCHLVLWDLETRISRIETSGWNGFYRLNEVFYSPNGQYVFTARRTNSGTDVSWWSTNGQLIATAPTTSFHQQVALADSGRILVGFEETAGQLNCDFWDVATGTQFRRWQCQVESLSRHGIYYAKLIGSAEGRYVGLLYYPDPWESNAATLQRLLGRPAAPLKSFEERGELIIFDAFTQTAIASRPAKYVHFSRDGRKLVIQDENENFSVYDLPLRKPWPRIFGFAGLGAMATFGGLMGLRRLLRRRESGQASAPVQPGMG
jgi:hypothetical protein